MRIQHTQYTHVHVHLHASDYHIPWRSIDSNPIDGGLTVLEVGAHTCFKKDLTACFYIGLLRVPNIGKVSPKGRKAWIKGQVMISCNDNLQGQKTAAPLETCTHAIQKACAQLDYPKVETIC